MGTSNLLANFLEPFVMTISLPRVVSSFGDLNDLAKGLNEVDRLLNRAGPDFRTGRVNRLRRHTPLTRFHVGSSPFLDVTTDLAWLAMLVTILAGYRPAKDGIKEIKSDTSAIFTQIEGLTEESIQTLKIGAQLMLERLLEGGEKASLKVAQRLHRARARLLGNNGGQVKISIKTIAGKSRTG